MILLSIVSCIKFIYEPDVWWQIKTGNWILENSQVPKVDMLSYTYNGDPWINVKWGSEVIMALIDRWFGVEFLPIIQALVLLFIVYLIVKITKIFNQSQNNRTASRLKLGLIWAITLMLFLVNFRLNGRPEMFSHLFAMVVIFLSIHYKNSNSNLIFLLVPLQLVWTNMHEAYGIGMIVMGLFVLSFWFEYVFFQKKHQVGISFKPIKYSISWVLSIFAVTINPNGFQMISHPFNILSQLNENKYTQELISFTTEGYWQYQSVFMCIIAVFLLLLFLKNKKGSLLHSLISQVGLGYALVMASFLYLSLTSFRNIPFFIFATTPLLAYYLASSKKEKFYGNNSQIATLFGLCIGYVLIASNVFYKNVLPTEKYGLQIDETKNPIGASQFIKENNIQGKGFVDYLSSSYMLYDNPEFKSYLDLRDLDVFPPLFFDNVFAVYNNPRAIYNGQTIWEFVDSVDKFNYVVLLNNQNFVNLNHHLLHETKDFVLVYGDMLSSIFLRNSPENKGLVEKYGFNSKNKFFRPMTKIAPPKSATIISSIFWPFYKVNSSEPAYQYQQELRSYYYYMKLQ